MRHGWKILLICCLAAVGCDRDSARSDATPADTTRTAEDAAEVQTLLGPLRAVSRAEVEFGELAAQRAGAGVIREYGQIIAADHRAVLTLLDDLARRRGATLSETGPALEMANMIRMAHAGLENLAGPDFDLPFIRAEVESHRQLLDRLDQQAIPAATSPELRDMLTDLRAMADAHLARARQLLASQLGESAEPPPPPPAPRPAQTPTPAPTPPPVPPDTTPPPTDTVRVGGSAQRAAS